MKKTLPTPKRTTDDQSQVREVNSRQPSRSSWKKSRGPPTSRGGIAIRASRARRPRTRRRRCASAIPGLPATTIAPPSAGPSTKSRFLVRPRSAFACWRRSALTVCGHEPDLAPGSRTPSRRAVDDLERDKEPERRMAGEHEGRGRRLRRRPGRATRRRARGCAAGGRRARRRTARSPRSRPGGRRGRSRDRAAFGPRQLEHGESERDPGDRVAERRDRRRREEQPVVAARPAGRAAREGNRGHRG